MRRRATAFIGFAALAVLLIGAARGQNPTVTAVYAPLPAVDARFGESVAGLGDLNADGTPDFAVGAPGENRAYVFSGADRTLIRTLQDPAALTGLRFGYAVASAGDVNGDGVDDVAVGAPGPDAFGAVPLPCTGSATDPCPRPDWGRAFVFSGATGALLRTLLPTDQDFLLFGFAFASLGDVNGDGKPDLAVAAPVLRRFWGEVYAFSGADGSQLWNTREPGPAPGDRQEIASFGGFLATLSDVTADGRRDLLVGAHFHDADPDPAASLITGRAYVLSGATGSIVRTHDNPSAGASGSFGAGVSAAGDQNADGVEDYAIGDAQVGVVRLFSGTGGSLLSTINSPGTGSTDRFGWSLAPVGDKSGDGRTDLWVGAPASGKVYLLDAAGTVLAQITEPVAGPAGSGGFGWRISPAGDLGGDVGADLVVGEPTEIVSAKTSAGAAFVVLLPPPNVPPSVGAIAAPTSAVQVGTPVSASAPFSDPNMTDTHTAVWDWGDGTTSAGVVSETNGSGTVTGSHVYSTSGFYTVTLTVTDDRGSSGSSVFEYVTVFDPARSLAANVKIISPPGAYTSDGTKTGDAFSTSSARYKNGVASGATSFQFNAVPFSFRSGSYDWLVVTAGGRGYLQGTGSVNGVPGYSFLLAVVDGSPDKYRLKVWNTTSSVVVYDSQFGAPINAPANISLVAGSIVLS